MKRRYRILFFISLTPLIGLSWLASALGSSMWNMFNLHLLGLLVSMAMAAFALARGITAKWPAGIATLGALPMTAMLLDMGNMFPALVKMLGPSFVLIAVGSLATLIAGTLITFLPSPPPPPEPPVAPARVVE